MYLLGCHVSNLLFVYHASSDLVHSLGYANVRTLTDASVRNCKGDIKEFRPTLMTGVPAVWESIRKGILAKISSASPKAQRMFQKAYATKAWLLERHLPTGFIDKVVFNKIKDQVGGRLRFALSGGAPMSVETQKFLSVTVCPILGGFGMTESKYTRVHEDMITKHCTRLWYVLYYDTRAIWIWSSRCACSLL